MTKSDRLKPVIKVAENRERAAVKILGEAQKIAQQRKKRLEELTSYRNDYCARFNSTQHAARPAAMLADFRVFLGRLDEAIIQQQKLLDASLRDVELKKQRWLAERTKTKALDKVSVRLRTRERRQADQKEQKETDERGQREPKLPSDDDSAQ